jgi:hypothetical protein
MTFNHTCAHIRGVETIKPSWLHCYPDDDCAEY